MKKTSLLLLLALAGMGTLQAQEARTCFVNMPDSLSPLLSSVNRADFIDFLDSKMKAEVANTFGGKSEMTELSSDYIRVKMTEQSTWQMKLLPVNDSTKVICTVSTVCAPASDSHIRFYTTAWEELPASSYLPALPALGDFMAEVSDSADVYQYQSVRRQADMLLLKADLSAEDTRLTLTFTTPDYMEKQAAEKLKPFLRRPLSYSWTGKGFK